MLFEHDWGRRDVQKLRMAYSEEMQAVGRFSLDKVRHLFDLILRTRQILDKNPNTLLFYPPASANWVPFLRDVIYLSQVRRKARGTVFIFHASGLAEWISKSMIRRWLARRAYAQADLALEVAVEEVTPHEIFETTRWEWCPCAAEVPLMKRGNPAEGQPLRVLFIGSLQEGKGVLEVIRTAANLKQLGLGSRFYFSIVGRWFSEEFKQITMRLVAELEVEELVSLPGELTGDAKWQAYKDADVCFFPSHYQSEASPIVLMEALGAGLPVISTCWRGIPKLLEGCESARLLPIRDSQAYAAALIDLDSKRTEFARLAVHSRSFYMSRYQKKHFTGRIENALDRQWPVNPPGGLLATETPNTPENKKSLRVLQVFNKYTEQGGEEVWVDQVTSLSDDLLRVNELRFHSRSWKMRGAPSPLTQASRMWDNHESRQQLRREIKNLEPDVLLFHNLIPIASFGLYNEAKKFRLPVLQYIHNFRPFSTSGTLWHGGRVRSEALHGNIWPEIFGRAWEGSLVKTAILAMYLRRLKASGWLDTVDHWIAISEFMRDKFIEAGIPESKITTLRHCWTPIVEETSDEDCGYYLFLGRLVPEKGIGTLLGTWQKLKQKLGKNCPQLVIAGTGPEESTVRAVSAQNEKIEHVGFLSGESKQRLLSGCRAVLAPSIWWEPLGLIVYEAYDHGKPVIAARSGGLVETVQEGQNGFLHNPGDENSLIDAILKLEDIGHTGRVRMGMTGRLWLLEKACPKAWKASFSKIVKSVIHD
jgi:glycosyltransferase involved in cell wall biosynthesis